jgi:chemotaxis protein histidine kinase CheA
MAAQRAQFIRPPNTLKAKVGSTNGKIDEEAIARAEQALTQLQDQFSDWIEEEIALLMEARNQLKASGPSDDAVDNVYRHTHDLKGLGTTYNFPMVTRIAGSLCRLIDQLPERSKLPVSIIDSHVNAIRAIVHEKIQDTENPIAVAVAAELEGAVAELLAKHKAEG